MNKLILNFKSKETKKVKNPKNFLGGKGANLSEMGRMGLPVPPGFTISTNVCEIFYKDKKKLNSKLVSQIKRELKVIEKDVSKISLDVSPLWTNLDSGPIYFATFVKKAITSCFVFSSIFSISLTLK